MNRCFFSGYVANAAMRTEPRSGKQALWFVVGTKDTVGERCFVYCFVGGELGQRYEPKAQNGRTVLVEAEAVEKDGRDGIVFRVVRAEFPMRRTVDEDATMERTKALAAAD